MSVTDKPIRSPLDVWLDGDSERTIIGANWADQDHRWLARDAALSVENQYQEVARGATLDELTEHFPRSCAPRGNTPEEAEPGEDVEPTHPPCPKCGHSTVADHHEHFGTQPGHSGVIGSGIVHPGTYLQCRRDRGGCGYGEEHQWPMPEDAEAEPDEYTVNISFDTDTLVAALAERVAKLEQDAAAQKRVARGYGYTLVAEAQASAGSNPALSVIVPRVSAWD